MLVSGGWVGESVHLAAWPLAVSPSSCSRIENYMGTKNMADSWMVFPQRVKEAPVQWDARRFHRQ